MGLAQALVIALLLVRGKPWHALAVTALLILQIRAMKALLADPKGKPRWYNATGIAMYVSGMMITAACGTGAADPRPTGAVHPLAADLPCGKLGRGGSVLIQHEPGLADQSLGSCSSSA